MHYFKATISFSLEIIFENEMRIATWIIFKWLFGERIIEAVISEDKPEMASNIRKKGKMH